MKKAQPKTGRKARPSAKSTNLEADLRQVVGRSQDHFAVAALMDRLAAMESDPVQYVAIPTYNSD